MRGLIFVLAGLIACGDDDGAVDAGGDTGTDTSVADTSIADTSIADTPTSDVPLDDVPVVDAPTADTGLAACADSWPPAIETLEGEVFAELNVRRAMTVMCGTTSVGPSSALTEHVALHSSTRCHAAYMAEEDMLTGTDADGGIFTDRATAAGYPGMATGAGFGFVRSDTTATTIVDGLLGSDGVCMNLLNPDATDVGVGIAPMDIGTGDESRRYYEIVVGN